MMNDLGAARAVIIATAVSLTFYLTGFFIFLVPLPFLVLSVRRGSSVAVMSFCISIALLAMTYQLPNSLLAGSTKGFENFLPFASFRAVLSWEKVTALGLVYYFYYGWMGILLGLVSQVPFRLEKGVFFSAAGTLLASLFIFLLMVKIMGWDIGHDLREGFQGMLTQFSQLQEKGVGQEWMATENWSQLQADAPRIFRDSLKVLPAAFINMTLMMLSLNVMFSRRLSIGAKPAFVGWGDFRLWRLPEWVIFIPIGLGIAFFANYYQLKNDVVKFFLLNIILVGVVVYFYQGLAIFYFWMDRLPPFFKILALPLFIFFFHFVFLAAGLVGLFDFWFDFRKLKKLA